MPEHTKLSSRTILSCPLVFTNAALANSSTPDPPKSNEVSSPSRQLSAHHYYEDSTASTRGEERLPFASKWLPCKRICCLKDPAFEG